MLNRRGTAMFDDRQLQLTAKRECRKMQLNIITSRLMVVAAVNARTHKYTEIMRGRDASTSHRMLTLLVPLDVAQSIKSSMRDAVIAASANGPRRKLRFLVASV